MNRMEKEMIKLLFGIISLMLAVYFIRKEPRSFRNAIFLGFGIVYTIIGIVDTIWYFFPPMTKGKNNTGTMNFSGDIIGILSVFATCIFMILGVILIFNGIMLLKKERVCLAHALPILFGILCLFLPIILILQNHFLMIFVQNSIIYGIACGISEMVIASGIYVPFTIASYFLYSKVYQRKVKNKPCDVIIIHGAKLIGDKPSPLLQKRIDKAIEVFEKYERKPFLIASGGRGDDEIVSEAEAMSKYLIAKGIPEEKIILEDKSTTTRENIIFSKEMLDKKFANKEYHCIFTTNNYHILRTAILAKKADLNADGVPCKTARYYLPAATIREGIAFIFSYKKLAGIYLLYSFCRGFLFTILPTIFV